MHSPLQTLPSPELLRRLHALVKRERGTEAELLSHLGEIDVRRLYLEEACSSMFDYCVRVLCFAEGVAFKRIQVARAARRHPALLNAVRSGALHVTGASLLAPHLTEENARELIEAARHRTAERIRELLADRRPRPAVVASVRRVPTPVAAPATAAREPARPLPEARPAPPAMRPTPLGEDRYHVHFTADAETWAQLRELRALMRHQVPDGDWGKILSRAVSALLAQVRKQKFAETDQPRPARPAPENPSRAIPAAIRREVARRDEGRCTFVSPSGRRCASHEFLEFHHVDPWQRSRQHSAAGITLRCRAHNQHQAERDFGRRHMDRFGNRRDETPAGTGFESGREPLSHDPTWQETGAG